MSGLGLDLIIVLAGAGVLALLLLALRGGVELLPLGARRDAARRTLPAAALLLVLIYALFAVRTLFAAEPVLAAVAMVLVLSGFVVVSWSALRDVVSGVFLKAGQLCRVGDHVRIEQLDGRIAHMGLRVLVLETSDGDEAIIPYSRVSREQLLRTPALDGVSPHVFRIAHRGASPAQLRQRIKRSALLVHWSAASREPEVKLSGDQLEVTVYALDPDRGPDIEAAVRRDLDVDSVDLKPSPRPSERAAPAKLLRKG